MIVGAKGGKLQLVLNTVYYLSSPVENIPWSYYKEFTEGKFKSYVDKAIPCCLGDYYQEFRVVGTTPEMFTLEPPSGRALSMRVRRDLQPDEFFTAVIGATVARKTGLTVGSTFQPTHGASDGHRARSVHRGRRARADRHAQRSGGVHQYRRLLPVRQPRQAAGRLWRRAGSRREGGPRRRGSRSWRC